MSQNYMEDWPGFWGKNNNDRTLNLEIGNWVGVRWRNGYISLPLSTEEGKSAWIVQIFGSELFRLLGFIVLAYFVDFNLIFCAWHKFTLITIVWTVSVTVGGTTAAVLLIYGVSDAGDVIGVMNPEDLDMLELLYWAKISNGMETLIYFKERKDTVKQD